MTKGIQTKNILIASGIYPPAIGGPAEYAKNLEDVWRAAGHNVVVKYFSFENRLPTGLRHVYFLLKSLPSIFRADYILVLDTFSVALPIAIGCLFLGKKFVIRTGGDFLWESYVERTGKKVLFKDFYNEINNFTKKESVIFRLTNWVVSRAYKIVFSTNWQKDIWSKPYNIDSKKTVIIENYYGPHFKDSKFQSKIFIGATRPLVWKNLDILAQSFQTNNVQGENLTLVTKTQRRDEYIKNLSDSYAVILVSLGDISPNMILDAIRANKPFIVTREIGIYERINDIALFVDPLDIKDIESKVIWLCNPLNYEAQKNKVANFSFTHSWEDIASEFLTI
jgi:hypothetical protein